MNDPAREVTQEVELPPNFCRILEPDNPDMDERFQCKDCGENFITLCTYQRHRLQLKSALQQNAALTEKLAAMTEDRNLWRDEHNGDCPNESQVKALTEEVEQFKAGAELATKFIESICESVQIDISDCTALSAEQFRQIELTVIGTIEQLKCQLSAIQKMPEAIIISDEELSRIHPYSIISADWQEGIVRELQAYRQARAAWIARGGGK